MKVNVLLSSSGLKQEYLKYIYFNPCKKGISWVQRNNPKLLGSQKTRARRELRVSELVSLVLSLALQRSGHLTSAGPTCNSLPPWTAHTWSFAYYALIQQILMKCLPYIYIWYFSSLRNLAIHKKDSWNFHSSRRQLITKEPNTLTK